MNDRPTWDAMFMSMAYLAASRSIDPSSRVGAVAVAPDNSLRAMGYNGPPRKMDDHGIVGDDGLPARLSPIDGAKYRYMEHAERNCIYNAGRNQTDLNGCTMYCNLPPCADCARGIIQVGISRLVLDSQGHNVFLIGRNGDNGGWNAAHDEVMTMLSDCGVVIDRLDDRRVLPIPYIHMSGIIADINGDE